MTGRKKQSPKDWKIGDMVGRIVSTGIGAAFMTEDSVRNLLKDVPLPKTVLAGLLQNAKTAKKDFTSLLRSELEKHFSKMDPERLLREVLNEYDVQINATLRFRKKRK